MAAEELQPVLEILTRPDSTVADRAAAMKVLAETRDPNAPLIPEGTFTAAGLGGLAGAGLGYLARPVARLTGSVRPDVSLRRLLHSVGREKDNWMKHLGRGKAEDPTARQVLDAFRAKVQRAKEAGMAGGAGAVAGGAYGAATAPEDPTVFERGQMDEDTYNAVLGVLVDPNMPQEARDQALDALRNQGEHLDTGLSTFGKVAIGGALGSILAGQVGRAVGIGLGDRYAAKAAKEGRTLKDGLTPQEKGENWGEFTGDAVGAYGGGALGTLAMFNPPENREYNRYLEAAMGGDREAEAKLRQVYARTLEESPIGEFAGGLAGGAIGLAAGSLPHFAKNKTLLAALKEKDGSVNILGLPVARYRNVTQEIPASIQESLRQDAANNLGAGDAILNATSAMKNTNKDFVFDKFADLPGAGPAYKELVQENAKTLRQTLTKAGIHGGIASTAGVGVGTALGADYSDPFAEG